MISASASRALILLASKNGQCHDRKRRSIAHAYFRKRRIPCSLIAFAFRGKTPLWATPICAILVAFTGRVDLLPSYSETQHRGMPAGRIFLYVCSVWNLSGGLPLCSAIACGGLHIRRGRGFDGPTHLHTQESTGLRPAVSDKSLETTCFQGFVCSPGEKRFI